VKEASFRIFPTRPGMKRGYVSWKLLPLEEAFPSWKEQKYDTDFQPEQEQSTNVTLFQSSVTFCWHLEYTTSPSVHLPRAQCCSQILK